MITPYAPFSCPLCHSALPTPFVAQKRVWLRLSLGVWRLRLLRRGLSFDSAVWRVFRLPPVAPALGALPFRLHALLRPRPIACPRGKTGKRHGVLPARRLRALRWRMLGCGRLRFVRFGRARCVPLRCPRCVRLRPCEIARLRHIGRLRGRLPLRHEIARVRHIGRLCQRLPLRCLRCNGLRAQGGRARAEEETDSDAEFEVKRFSGCLFVAMNRQPENVLNANLVSLEPVLTLWQPSF